MNVARWFRSLLRDLRHEPMLSEVVTGFAKVGHDDHEDLQRIGQRKVWTDADPRGVPTRAEAKRRLRAAAARARKPKAENVTAFHRRQA